MISPQFRVEQWLKNSLGDPNNSLWSLLVALAGSFDPREDRIEQWRYQDQRMILSLSCSDYLSLERFESRLQHSPLRVKQTEASKQGDRVLATLELSL